MKYRTEFLEKIERTASVVSYRFKFPNNLQFSAGQHMTVDLGSGLSHVLSFSSSPQESGFIEFTKRMSGSPYCERLASLEPGDIISTRGPFGKFCFQQSDKTLVMIAGGIGITPIRSILKSLLKSQRNPGKIILIYGNLERSDIAFKEELENIAIPDYRMVHVLSDTRGMQDAHKGFISADIISQEVPQCESANYMVSGPPAMIRAMKEALAKLAISEKSISFDSFTGYH